jgi:hypothetical protein
MRFFWIFVKKTEHIIEFYQKNVENPCLSMLDAAAAQKKMCGVRNRLFSRFNNIFSNSMIRLGNLVNDLLKKVAIR